MDGAEERTNRDLSGGQDAPIRSLRHAADDHLGVSVVDRPALRAHLAGRVIAGRNPAFQRAAAVAAKLHGQALQRLQTAGEC